MCIPTRSFINIFILVLFGSAFILLSTACMDVAPTNPYDPSTPAAQQAKGSVKGSVLLAANEQDIRVFDQSKALLYSLDTALSEAIRCDSETSKASLYSSELTSLENKSASFELNEVQANDYWLVICVLGYEAQSELVRVQRGEDTLHTFTLTTPNEVDLESGVRGIVSEIRGIISEIRGSVSELRGIISEIRGINS